MPKTTAEIEQEISQKIDALITRFQGYNKKGIKAIDVIKFILECATELVEEVEHIEGIPGPQKKEVVIASAKGIYWKINPDIPVLPEFVETPLEKWLLDLLLEPFIDFVVDLFGKKGIFK